MVHDIPHGGSEERPRLTDAPITLDDGLRAYFRTKIVSSLGLRGVQVVADPDRSAVVREAVVAVIDDPGELVPSSKLVAEHLHHAQTGRNPAGLLTVVLGRLEGEACVCVLKLEREQGLRFNIETDEHGHNTVDLELLRELTLTDKTKVFKTSLLVSASGGGADSVTGRVSDDQRGRHDGIGVATFYLNAFLGCQLKDSPAKQTLAFVKGTDAFINDHVTNPQTQGTYQVAVLAEMQSNTMDLRPQDFAQTHLQPADRGPFMQAMRDAGVDPTVPFEKDTSLVKVSKFRIDFEHGLVLVGPPEAVDRHVVIRDASADRPGAEINDVIKRLGGR
jgi:hypothetical protein